MRVVMLTGRYGLGGAERQAMMLVRGLERRHEVHFITTGERDEAFVEGGHRRIVVALPRRSWFWHNYRNPSVVRKVKAHLEDIKPDVLHFHNVHNRTLSLSSLLASRRYPTVWTLHDVWSQCVWSIARPARCEGTRRGCWGCVAMPGLAVIDRRIKEAVFRRSPLHVVCPSEWLRRRISSSVLATKPVEVIPNGVEVARFEGADGAPVRQRLGIPAEARVVLLVAHMLKNVKGHADLLNLAPKILADEEDVWFVLVGPHNEPEPDYPHVILTGPAEEEDIPRYYAAADVLAYPTHADNFPDAVLQAMAASLPVVAHRVGGIPEQIVDGETGVLVDEGDPVRFERELRLLLQDAEMRRSMGKRGRERARRLFTVETQLARLETLYGRAASVPLSLPGRGLG